MNIIDYRCLYACDEKALSDRVVNLIKDGKGWQPFGSVSVSGFNDDGSHWGYFAQAMVRYQDRVPYPPPTIEQMKEACRKVEIPE